MINKFKTRFKELSNIASRIIVNGMRISCLMMSVGLVMRILNIRSENYSLYIVALSKYIFEAAVSIAAIIIIGGLMFDYYFKKYNTEK